MDEETANELIRTVRYDLVPLVPQGTVVLPLEAHGVAFERHQPAVADGDAMGVARKVGGFFRWIYS